MPRSLSSLLLLPCGGEGAGEGTRSSPSSPQVSTWWLEEILSLRWLGEGGDLSSTVSGWGWEDSPPPPPRSEGAGGCLSFPTKDLGGVPPLSPCSCVGMKVGEDTRASFLLTTLGASLPSPSPSEGGWRGREGGVGETDLVEAVSMGSPAWWEDNLLRPA